MTEAFSEIKLTFASRNNPHPELSFAFDEGDVLTLRLTAPRCCGLSSPELLLEEGDALLLSEGGAYEKRPVRALPFLWEKSDFVTECYALTLPMEGLLGLSYLSVLFDSSEGTLRFSYSPERYFPRLTKAEEDFEPFALTVYRRDYTTPAWFKGGLMYQIFVDRFAKGSVPVPLREGAILNPDWERGIPQFAPYRGAPLANNMFFGGTLWGVAEKLDYLVSLGVNVLYLSPIFRAYSNHKYDTGDYLEVDEMFGGEEALTHLLSEAKARGIRVILDGVFNHTGDDSRYFNRYGRYDSLGAYQSTDSPYYDWYSFSEYPSRYRSWWGIDILPAVNTGSPSYQDFICGEEGVIRRYLKKGISGWRLDVADELSEDLLRRIRQAGREEKRDSLLIGEVWEDAAEKVAYGRRRHYFQGDELDGVMNYPAGNAILDYVMTGKAEELFVTLKRLYAHYPKPVSDAVMNLLGTHDTERVLTRLSGVGENGRSEEELALAALAPAEREAAAVRLRIAYFLLSVLPGVPCIYYGDEAGMEGYHDPFNRRPFPWGREDPVLLAFYRRMGEIRRGEELFAEGWLRLVGGLPAGVFALERFEGEESLLAAVNLSEDTVTLSRPGQELLSGREVKTRLYLKKQSFCLIKSKKAPDLFIRCTQR